MHLQFVLTVCILKYFNNCLKAETAKMDLGEGICQNNCKSLCRKVLEDLFIPRCRGKFFSHMANVSD